MTSWVAGTNAAATNGGLTVACTGAGGNAFSDLAVTGKIYFEFTVDSASQHFGVGVANASETSYVAGTSNSAGGHEDGALYNCPSGTITYVSSSKVDIGNSQVPWVSGDVVSVAIDVPNKKLWMRVNGGTWNTYISGDPTTGAGAVSFSHITGTAYLYFQGDNTGAGITANFGGSAYSYSAPTGYTNLGGATGTGSGTFALSASASGGHGVAGTGAKTLTLTGSGTGTQGFTGTGDATIALQAAGQGAYGTGAGAGTFTLSASGTGAHGVSGAAQGTLSLLASASGAHIPGVSGTGSATLAILAAAAGTYADINGGWTPIAANAETWSPIAPTAETWTAA